MSILQLVRGTAQRLPLASSSIDCCVTSPPYWGLRSYAGLEPEVWLGGTLVQVPGVPPTIIPGPQIWEDLADCAHMWVTRQTRMAHTSNGTGVSTLQSAHAAWAVAQVQTNRLATTDAICARCGCWRGCLGNEPTPDMYLWHLVLVLREVRRALKDTAVLWLVLGDTYSSGNRVGDGTRTGYKQTTNRGMNGTADRERAPQPASVPQGSLLMIPHRLALAAQADGWVVRNDNVWAKTAPMPESVQGWRWQRQGCACLVPRRALSGTQGSGRQGHRENSGNLSHTPHVLADHACPTCHGTGQTEAMGLRQGSWRHTRAHEQVFMLTKQMGYFANSEAVREAATMTPQRRRPEASLCTYDPPGRSPSRGDRGAKDVPGVDGPGGRNPRSVLMPAPSPLHLEHYASFPPGLIEPLIRATCPERVCTACGEPWAPVVVEKQRGSWPERKAAGATSDVGSSAVGSGVGTSVTMQTGLASTCVCPADTPWRPGVCLDPFGGAATTAMVARALGRHSISVEASAFYLHLAKRRLGLTDLEAWLGQSPAPTPECYDDLPLFAL